MTGRWHPGDCRECGRTAVDGFKISASGLCEECGERLLMENVNGLRSHAGAAFRRWRRGMAASVGAVLLDERADEG